jgi:hypothetical protein
VRARSAAPASSHCLPNGGAELRRPFGPERGVAHQRTRGLRASAHSCARAQSGVVRMASAPASRLLLPAIGRSELFALLPSCDDFCVAWAWRSVGPLGVPRPQARMRNQSLAPTLWRLRLPMRRVLDGPWTDPMVGRNSSTRHPRSLLPRLSPLRGERGLLRATRAACRPSGHRKRRRRGHASAPPRPQGPRRCGEHHRGC